MPRWARRDVFGLSLCSLGVGTYLGETDDTVDSAQKTALVQLLGKGCNVIDTAPNYRGGRSERCIGEALRLSIEQGAIVRESVFLSTKAGLVPENESLPSECHEGPDRSCFDPLWLEMSVHRSLKRLGLESVDCVFLHNLEFLRMADGKDFLARFAKAAECMETLASQGHIGAWGISSWNGFRVPEDHPEYLSLAELASIKAPHMRFLQLPLGLWGSEAVTGKWQRGKSVLEEAEGLAVFANSPLLQGELATALAKAQLVEKAIRFTRDTEGVSVALLGMKRQPHIEAWHKMQYESSPDPKGIVQEFDTFFQ